MTDRLLEILRSSEVKDDFLSDVSKIIFEKAVSEPEFVHMYASLCKDLFAQDKDKALKRKILTLIQDEFTSKSGYELTRAEFADLSLEERTLRQRLRRRGNVAFAGELFNIGLLASIAIGSALDELIKTISSDDIELACDLLLRVGRKLDSSSKPNEKKLLDSFVLQLERISSAEKDPLEPRVRFKLRDILRLRDLKWDRIAAANRSRGSGSARHQPTVLKPREGAGVGRGGPEAAASARERSPMLKTRPGSGASPITLLSRATTVKLAPNGRLPVPTGSSSVGAVVSENPFGLLAAEESLRDSPTALSAGISGSSSRISLEEHPEFVFSKEEFEDLDALGSHLERCGPPRQSVGVILRMTLEEKESFADEVADALVVLVDLKTVSSDDLISAFEISAAIAMRDELRVDVPRMDERLGSMVARLLVDGVLGPLEAKRCLQGVEKPLGGCLQAVKGFYSHVAHISEEIDDFDWREYLVEKEDTAVLVVLELIASHAAEEDSFLKSAKVIDPFTELFSFLIGGGGESLPPLTAAALEDEKEVKNCVLTGLVYASGRYVSRQMRRGDFSLSSLPAVLRILLKKVLSLGNRGLVEEGLRRCLSDKDSAAVIETI